MSSLLPIFLKLRDRPVLVVGGGRIAAEKLPKLINAGAIITLVARHVSAEVRALASSDSSRVSIAEREVALTDLPGHVLVINATDDAALNHSLAQAARGQGIWSNAVDDAAHSDFFMAGTIERGPLIVAIGSAGRFPGLVRGLRALLEDILPAEHMPAFSELVAIRAALKERLPERRERFAVLSRVGRDLAREYFALSTQGKD